MAGNSAKITWRDAYGVETTVKVAVGTSLMQAAVEAGVQGIFGDCGGNLACATCHVVPDAAWQGCLGVPSAMEEEMLDLVEGERFAASRLSCQIIAAPEMDGLILVVPPV